jgi:hypothetical protein
MTRKLILALSLFLLGLLPMTAEAGQSKSFKLFGMTWCFGDTPTVAACDYRVPLAPRVGEAKHGKVVELLGLEVCLGTVPADKECDLRIPPLTSSQDRRQASL